MADMGPGLQKYMLNPGLLKEECNPCPRAEYVDGTSSWFRHTYSSAETYRYEGLTCWLLLLMMMMMPPFPR